MTVWERFRLDGRTALVTGASRGLGRAIAQALAEAGADLIIVGRDPGRLAQAQAELALTGRAVYAVAGDIGSPQAALAACHAALRLGLDIDILVNNVGGRRLDVPAEEVALADWAALMDLNLTSALVCCQRIGVPMLARRRGVVVNVTSIAGPVAIPGIRGRHYEVAKAGLAALTKSLAGDWAPRGVRVNALAPGVFETEPNHTWFRTRPEFKTRFLSHIPMARLGRPDELGPAAVFLASDASSYMTGATLTIDGGYTAW